MDAVFLKIVNMSLTASWLVLAVVLLRLLLKKAPKALRCVLWALVGVRLVCPFSIESALSLIPSAQPIPETITTDTVPAVNSGLPSVNAVVNPILSDSFTPAVGDSVNPLQVLAYIAAWLWLVGMAVLLIYAAVSYLRVRRQVGACLHLRDNIYACDGLPSPFILGVVRPRIYLPTGLDDAATAHIIAHEQAHLHRRDHWWKPLGFLLLTVHWFNPVMWVAYILLCRDIELACDERVVRTLDADGKAAYSRTLLACGARRRAVAACPLAFGEVGVKARVKSVLNYKKPAFWIILTALLVVIAVAVAFLTNPRDKMPPDGTYRRESTVCIVDNQYKGSYGLIQHVDWRVDDGTLYRSSEGESNWRQVGRLHSVKLTKDNFDRYTDESLRNEVMQPYWVGAWQQKTNVSAKLRRQTKRAWRCEDTEYREFIYLFETYGGDYYAAYGKSSGEGDVPMGEFVITALAAPAQDTPPPATGLYELSELVCYLDDGDKPNGEFSLFLDNGMLYICRDTDKSKLGQLESFTLTKENFNSFFENPSPTYGEMVWNTDTTATDLRKNTVYAWRYVTAEGHPCYYYVLQMKNGVLLFCSGMDDTAIHNFFYIYKIKPVEGFCATVLEANKFTLLVEPFEGEEIRRSADKIEVPIAHLSLLYPTPAVPELYEGDQVWIQYSGEVQETYPARLSGVPDAVMIIVGHRDPATINTYALSVMSTDNTHLEKVFTRDASDPNSYNVYYYAASAVTVNELDGESVELKTALADGRITAAQLLAQAKKDVNAGVCRKDLYDDGGSVEYRYGGYGLLLRYTDKESGDDTTGLYDVYVMPNGVSLTTLNDLLSGNHTTTTTQQVYTTTPHPSTNGTTQTTTTTKPDTCKVNPTVILAIEGNTVIVDAAEHYIHRNDDRYQAYDRCAFDVSGIADIHDFKVGDKVNVIHTGEFTEGDPPRGRLLALRHIE